MPSHFPTDLLFSSGRLRYLRVRSVCLVGLPLLRLLAQLCLVLIGKSEHASTASKTRVRGN